MKYQRRKTVLTVRKLVSDGQEVSTGDAQTREANRAEQDRHRGTTGARGHAGAGGKRTRVEGAGRRRRSGAEGGLDTGRDVREGPTGSTRLRAAPLASPPTFSGPRTRLRPPAAGWGQGVRAGPDDEAAASCPAPGKRGPEAGRRVGRRAGQRGGTHLSTRAASARACALEEFGVQLEGVLTRVSTIPPRAHSHRHRSNRNHRKPGVSQFVTGCSALGPAPPPASMRSRLGPEGARPASDTCVQQVPARGPAPGALPSPSRCVPPSRRRGPAPSGLRVPPPRSPQPLCPRRRQPRFQDLLSFPGPRSRVPARTEGLRQ